MMRGRGLWISPLWFPNWKWDILIQYCWLMTVRKRTQNCWERCLQRKNSCHFLSDQMERQKRRKVMCRVLAEAVRLISTLWKRKSKALVTSFYFRYSQISWFYFLLFIKVQLLYNNYVSCCYSVSKSCPALFHPMDSSTPGSSVLHYLPDFVPVHVHWVCDAI